MLHPHPRRNEIITYLKGLREEIIAAFEALEGDGCFERKPWQYQHDGGGEMAVIRGEVFEKAAVNWSGVGGPTFPMGDSKGPFFATGVSLITHLFHPRVPTVHMNVRFIETDGGFWFGGGYDLTPMGFPYAEDTAYFHSVAKRALDPYGDDLYAAFSENAKKYFFIPHRNKERGVGGLFFDHFNSGDFERDFQIMKAVGDSLLEAIIPIYEHRLRESYSAEDKETQLRQRAHYVEYNLLYDRGTKFGFLSGGNPEAILCSMPPVVKW